jgi:TRAP-type mannitol/chloroaromatic compound transport system permease small subunit
MWPFRASVPLAAALLMVQGVSEALKSWFQIRTGREFEHREKVEV